MVMVWCPRCFGMGQVGRGATERDCADCDGGGRVTAAAAREFYARLRTAPGPGAGAQQGRPLATAALEAALDREIAGAEAEAEEEAG